MENALIISSSEKGIDSISSVLKLISCKKISMAKSSGEARRATLQKNYDLFIINSPIGNESGEDLAKELVEIGTSQVIFIVKNENYDYISSKVENLGVITVSKPLSKTSLLNSFKLARAMWNRLEKIQKQNTKLLKKLEELRIIGRAKCVLISNLNLSEEDAHRYIEKKSMDTRESRVQVAEEILKTFVGKE